MTDLTNIHYLYQNVVNESHGDLKINIYLYQNVVNESHDRFIANFHYLY